MCMYSCPTLEKSAVQPKTTSLCSSITVITLCFICTILQTGEYTVVADQYHEGGWVGGGKRGRGRGGWNVCHYNSYCYNYNCYTCLFPLVHPKLPVPPPPHVPPPLLPRSPPPPLPPPLHPPHKYAGAATCCNRAKYILLLFSAGLNMSCSVPGARIYSQTVKRDKYTGYLNVELV